MRLDPAPSLSKGGLDAAPWFDKLTMGLETPGRARHLVLSPSKDGHWLKPRLAASGVIPEQAA